MSALFKSEGRISRMSLISALYRLHCRFLAYAGVDEVPSCILLQLSSKGARLEHLPGLLRTQLAWIAHERTTDYSDFTDFQLKV